MAKEEDGDFENEKRNFGLNYPSSISSIKFLHKFKSSAKNMKRKKSDESEDNSLNFHSNIPLSSPTFDLSSVEPQVDTGGTILSWVLGGGVALISLIALPEGVGLWTSAVLMTGIGAVGTRATRSQLLLSHESIKKFLENIGHYIEDNKHFKQLSLEYADQLFPPLGVDTAATSEGVIVRSDYQDKGVITVSVLFALLTGGVTSFTSGLAQGAMVSICVGGFTEVSGNVYLGFLRFAARNRVERDLSMVPNIDMSNPDSRLEAIAMNALAPWGPVGKSLAIAGILGEECAKPLLLLPPLVAIRGLLPASAQTAAGAWLADEIHDCATTIRAVAEGMPVEEIPKEIKAKSLKYKFFRVFTYASFPTALIFFTMTSGVFGFRVDPRPSLGVAAGSFIVFSCIAYFNLDYLDNFFGKAIKCMSDKYHNIPRIKEKKHEEAIRALYTRLYPNMPIPGDPESLDDAVKKATMNHEDKNSDDENEDYRPLVGEPSSSRDSIKIFQRDRCKSIVNELFDKGSYLVGRKGILEFYRSKFSSSESSFVDCSECKGPGVFLQKNIMTGEVQIVPSLPSDTDMIIKDETSENSELKSSLRLSPQLMNTEDIDVSSTESFDIKGKQTICSDDSVSSESSRYMLDVENEKDGIMFFMCGEASMTSNPDSERLFVSCSCGSENSDDSLVRELSLGSLLEVDGQGLPSTPVIVASESLCDFKKNSVKGDNEHGNIIFIDNTDNHDDNIQCTTTDDDESGGGSSASEAVEFSKQEISNNNQDSENINASDSVNLDEEDLAKEIILPVITYYPPVPKKYRVQMEEEQSFLNNMFNLHKEEIYLEKYIISSLEVKFTLPWEESNQIVQLSDDDEDYEFDLVNNKQDDILKDFLDNGDSFLPKIEEEHSNYNEIPNILLYGSVSSAFTLTSS